MFSKTDGWFLVKKGDLYQPQFSNLYSFIRSQRMVAHNKWLISLTLSFKLELGFFNASFLSSRPDVSCLSKHSDCMNENPLCARIELDLEIPFYTEKLMHLSLIDFSPDRQCLRNYILSKVFDWNIILYESYCMTHTYQLFENLESYIDEKNLRFLRDQSYDQFFRKLLSLYR